ncbi:tRNA pseudouridine(13) synthase TruD [Sinimarinibacterium sp. NLF-5-8]|uniref:tRNA pseudouridine(13) synthase TruD n=1 Tax=Sinimarinibacterium sp. NLF-5-8 TaxID=2698684 RepID=UPI00137BA2A2|nr:tRNA pseudouridine(13) synthase TruD [Sinimarinibacterium sp. NLF-5-8]QHS10350.1 tRNA pseudouridine(13) synthase TruD [Sinimarinibacterium sp. NLF-5-8]
MTSELPFAYGGAVLRGILRAQPEDFCVTEIQPITPEGSGEHAWLWVRKRGANTDWVAKGLARFAGVKPMDVSYAGQKDRHAVTEQAFTVHLPGRESPDWSQLDLEGVTVVSHSRHNRKLKRGALQGNVFEITLREVSGDAARAQVVLEQIRSQGVPNYFGEQRFGLGGGNVERARKLFAGQRCDRATRSLLISAARSHLFNAVLHERVVQGSWNQPLEGEVWCLNGSHAWFGPEVFSDDLRARLAAGDIHPSGPLWGRGRLRSSDAALTLEQTTLAPFEDLRNGLEHVGLEQDRRALRLIPHALNWEWLDTATLRLRFALPSGAYATTVLREVVDWAAGDASHAVG